MYAMQTATATFQLYKLFTFYYCQCVDFLQAPSPEAKRRWDKLRSM